MLIRTGMMQIDLSEGLVAEGGGRIGGHSAQHQAGSFSVLRGITGTLAGLGREGCSLREGRRILARVAAQLGDCRSGDAAGIGACESHAAPRIFAIQRPKASDGCGDGGHLGALGKPQTAAEALIENAAGIQGQASKRVVEQPGFVPVEITLVETVAVDYQPTQNGMQSANGALNAGAQPGKSGIGPSCANVQHVDMIFSPTG